MQSVLYAECYALSCYADWRHFYQLWLLRISSTNEFGGIERTCAFKVFDIAKKKKIGKL